MRHVATTSMEGALDVSKKLNGNTKPRSSPLPNEATQEKNSFPAQQQQQHNALFNTTNTNYKNYSITPPRQLSLTEQFDRIDEAPVGTLTQSDVQLLQQSIETHCRVTSRRRHGGSSQTSRRNTQRAEGWLHRWIQEVNYFWAATTTTTTTPTNNPSPTTLQPDGIQPSDLIIPVKVWKAVILGCANLPLEDDGSSSGGSSTTSPQTTPPTVTTLPFQVANSHLQRMIHLHQLYPTLYHAPTEGCYSAVLHGCSNCSAVSTAAVTTAEAIVRTLEENAGQSTSVVAVAPTVEIYNHVILAHANRAAHVYGAAAAAEDWLMHMSSLATAATTRDRTTGETIIQPNTQSFNRVLKAWSNSPEEQGGNRAADILHLMLELSSSGIANCHRLEPDAISFGTVITAFAKRHQPEQCQAILEEAVTYYSNKGDTSALGRKARDLTQCWNATLFAWAESGYPDAPERVESLIQQGISVGPTKRQLFIQPTTATYAACIDAHLRSSRPNRIEKAESHLLAMVGLCRNHFEQARHAQNPDTVRPPNTLSSVPLPTTKEFETVIHAWYRSQKEYEGDDSEGIGTQDSRDMRRRRPHGFTATRATNLLRTMIELSDSYRNVYCAPSSGIFDMCIDSWCNAAIACASEARKENDRIKSLNEIDDDIVERARAQAKELENQASSFVGKAFGVLDVAENRRLAKPFCYITIIKCLCRMEDSTFAFIAAKTLGRWERETDKRTLPWPSTANLHYKDVFAFLGETRTLEAAEQALSILQAIPNAGPRSVKGKESFYTAVVVAFATFPSPRTTEVAKELFQEMSTLDQDPDSTMSLNTVFCERVLWALADAKDKDAASSACEILSIMLDRHSLGKPNIAPSTHCFNACIHALTECQDEKYLKYAVSLIQSIVNHFDMQNVAQLPSPAAFNKVIRCCKDAGSAEMVQHANEIIRIAQRLASSTRRTNEVIATGLVNK